MGAIGSLAQETLREARAAHYEQSGFSAADYSNPWARVQVGPLVVVFPNWPARGRALELHDLHHAVTGYDTSLVGEAETAGWEIANGCGRHLVSWVLELQAFAFGLFLCPRRLYRAFMNGRGGANFFALDGVSDDLLDSPVHRLRAELGLESAGNATARDRLAFVGWSLVALADGAFAVLIALLPLTWLAWAVLHLAYARDQAALKAKTQAAPGAKQNVR